METGRAWIVVQRLITPSCSELRSTCKMLTWKFVSSLLLIQPLALFGRHPQYFTSDDYLLYFGTRSVYFLLLVCIIAVYSIVPLVLVLFSKNIPSWPTLVIQILMGALMQDVFRKEKLAYG